MPECLYVGEILICNITLISDTHGFIRRVFCLRARVEGLNTEVPAYFPNRFSTRCNKDCVPWP